MWYYKTTVWLWLWLWLWLYTRPTPVPDLATSSVAPAPCAPLALGRASMFGLWWGRGVNLFSRPSFYFLLRIDGRAGTVAGGRRGPTPLTHTEARAQLCDDPTNAESRA